MWQRAVQLVTLGACASAVVMSACDGPAATSDAGLDGGARFDAARDAGATCAADESCDDGLFCNGAERCAPGAAGADARGCAPAADTTPCDDTEVCDEASDACEADDCEDPDADRDGHDRVACGGDDCDDESATRFPGNTEICDALNVDEDCDPRTFGVRDLDGDGETDALCCNVAGDGTMRCGPDCDDARASTHTAGAEVCNGRDDDCDGTVDDGALLTFYPDADRDGRGDASGTPVSGCTPPEGYALLADDCDDTSAARFPGNAETCDAAGVDEDCDGEANPISLCTCSEGETRPCARAGACAAGTESCTLSGTWGACSIDPVPEVCNGADDDCDGLADDGVSIICYADGDNDGYAEIGAAVVPTCPTAGRDAVGGCPPYTTNRDPSAAPDCNDASFDVRPGAGEVCNGVDDDCDSTIDEGVRVTYYADCDGDGQGTSAGSGATSCGRPRTAEACPGFPPTGYSTSNTDCRDDDSFVFLGATETCDGKDNNCNGTVDEGVTPNTYYRDADGDGWVIAGDTVTGCSAPSGYIALSAPPSRSDCDDTDPTINPGAAQRCGSVDTDCDPSTPSTTPTWYVDCDLDGYSPMGAAARTQCDAPAEATGCSGGGGQWQSTYPTTVPANVDCNDDVATVHPGADELCDGYDTDCRRVSTHGLDFLHEDDDDDGYADCAGLPIGRMDCNDLDPAIHPSATETVADGVDYDCDGQEICYRNSDGDSHRTATTVLTSAISCPTASGYALASRASGDCCDSDARAFPGATSFYSSARSGCGGYDFDCDGASTQEITYLSTGGCSTDCTEGYCDCVPDPDLEGWATSVPACGASGTLVIGCRTRSTGACNGLMTTTRQQACR